MDLSQLKINPEFVNMVIRTAQGEHNVHDVHTANPIAAQAEMLRIERLRTTNAHFIAQICQASLFQEALFECIQQVSQRTNADDKRAVLALFVAQAILIGMHLHEQLLDKQAKGVRLS